MLQSIRDRTQGWIAGIIISLLILSFAMWGIHSYFGEGGNASNVAAQVNDVPITKNQLHVAFERLRRQLQSSTGSTTITPQIESALRKNALQSLVDMEVMRQGSIAAGFRISNTQVDDMLENMPEFQVNGQFSVPRFQQLISLTSLSPADFLELLRTTLLIDQPRLGLTMSSFATPEEVQQNVALVNQERDITYLNFTFKDYLKNVRATTDSEIQKYYEEHLQLYKVPEEVSIQYVTLSVDKLMNSIHPSADIIKTFYSENISSYTKPMKWNIEAIYIPRGTPGTDGQKPKIADTATSIYKKLKQGDDFTHYATLYPSQASGMNLKGWVSLNQLPTEMQKLLSSLRAAKSISPVIELNNGFYILKVSEIKNAEVQPFEKVKDKVTENYKRQKAQELFAKVRDKLAELTYNKHPESLKPVVDELALPIETTGLFTIDKPDAPNDITANRKIREAAFSEDVLTTKNNSDIIQVDSNTAVVLRIKDHQPASTKPLNSVKADIDEALKISHSKAAAKSAVNNILAELKSNKISLDDAAKSVNLSNISVGYIGRYSSKVDPAILEKAFSIPRSNQKGIFTYSVAETPNGLAIIRLNSVRAGNVGSNTQQKESFAEQVQNSYGSMEYKLYQDNLSESAKITYP